MSGYFYSHRPSPQFGPGHPHGPPPFLPLHLHSPHASTHPHHTELPRPYDPRLQPRAPSPWQPEAIGSPRPLFSPQEQQAIPQSMSMYRLPLMPPSGVPLIHGFNMAAPPPPVIAGPPNGGSLLGQYQSDTVMLLPQEPPDPFIEDWLNRVGRKRGSFPVENKTSLKIPEVRQLLSRVSHLVATLHMLHTQLSVVAHDDTDTWRSLWCKVQEHKTELLSVRDRLEVPGLIDHLVKKLKNTAARRGRFKRAREALIKSKSERTRMAEELTDKWLRERRQEELRLKTEKSVQGSARQVLEEVQRKQSEIRQLQDLLTALDKLREHRKENRRKGEVLPPNTDEMYTHKFKELEELLSQQMSDYKDEEHTLRVLMAEEVQEKMSSQQTQQTLLGVPAAEVSAPLPSLTDPLEAHSRYWLQAQTSDECKSQIRRSWSCFEHPGGSSMITEGETGPPLSCGPAWKHFIVDSYQK